MREYKPTPDQQIDWTQNFMESVAVMSGSDKGVNLTNSRTYDLPNNRIAFRHDPRREKAVLYIQPRVLFREGDYLRIEVSPDKSDLEAMKGIYLSLEDILTIEESRDKNNVVREFQDDEERSSVVGSDVISKAVDIIQTIQKRDTKGRFWRFKKNLIAERKIRNLVSYIREYNL